MAFFSLFKGREGSGWIHRARLPLYRRRPKHQQAILVYSQSFFSRGAEGEGGNLGAIVPFFATSHSSDRMCPSCLRIYDSKQRSTAPFRSERLEADVSEDQLREDFRQPRGRSSLNFDEIRLNGKRSTLCDMNRNCKVRSC